MTADYSREASVYRRSMNMEASEATYNCKIGFVEALVCNISFNINIYLVFLAPHPRMWYTVRTMFKNSNPVSFTVTTRSWGIPKEWTRTWASFGI